MSIYDLDKILENKITKYSFNSPIKELKILVAYSGGVDSSVLLHIVNILSIRIGFKYDFVYINHNMNPKSNQILKLGKDFENKNNCNFLYHEIDKKPIKNKESFFRDYRYNYFNNLKKINKYDFIFTAHHYNDQIETLYMKTRGRYDWTNLMGVRESKDYIKRPFLKIKKSLIIKYAIKNAIPWIFDDTNNNNNILRNNIRNLIIPKRSIFLDIWLLLLNKYSILNFYLFQKKINKIKNKIVISQSDLIILDKIYFLKLNSNYRKLFLQSILKTYNNNKYIINKNSKWSALWVYLSKNKNLNDFILDRNFIINNSKKIIVIRNKKDYDKRINLSHKAIWDNSIFKIEELNSSSEKIINRNSMYVDSEIFKEGLFIRNWSTGDYYIDYKNDRKRVSKLFLKNKFNKYEKMRQPLVVDSSDKILWIPGLINGLNNNCFLMNNNCIKISKEILN